MGKSVRVIPSFIVKVVIRLQMLSCSLQFENILPRCSLIRINRNKLKGFGGNFVQVRLKEKKKEKKGKRKNGINTIRICFECFFFYCCYEFLNL